MHRVLVAEDNPQGAELIGDYLDGQGWEIAIVGDGEATLAKIKEWKPDVVLLDVMMPKLSGFEVCKRLRRDSDTKQLPVLMITALDQPADVDRAVDAGTNDFLTKPIHRDDLIHRVKALLASRGSSNAIDQTIEYVQAVSGAAQ